MLSDRELWACATLVEKEHGNRAALFVAERLGKLALKGDADGIQTWQAIARRLDELRADPRRIAS
jgi:hypothetical protein